MSESKYIIISQTCTRWLIFELLVMIAWSGYTKTATVNRLKAHVIQRNDPETFARAVAFDDALRLEKLPGVTGDAYIHRSMVPLRMVDLRNMEDHGQQSMFTEDHRFGFENECDGMCGV